MFLREISLVIDQCWSTALGLRPPCLLHPDSVLWHWVTLQPNRGVSILIRQGKNMLETNAGKSVSSLHKESLVSFFWCLLHLSHSSFLHGSNIHPSLHPSIRPSIHSSNFYHCLSSVTRTLEPVPAILERRRGTLCLLSRQFINGNNLREKQPSTHTFTP